MAMQYRRFGHLGFEVSALGFGCMRLPTLGDGSIDEPEAIRMLHYAIDQGVNYLDTAYVYHNGQSEVLVGKALREGYRHRVKLATKLPTWLVSQQSDFDRFLNEQLGRLQTDHIDLYLIHGLRKGRWPLVRDLGVCEWAQRAIADGRIGHLGFSFHDVADVFTQIVDEYDGWGFCQIQYNYMDEKSQAGTAGLKYAAAKGLGVVVMEPLLGGRLAEAPDEVQAIWDDAAVKRSPAEWGLQWLWNQPEVSVVLSGMSTMQQVLENVASASRSGVGVLSADEVRLVEAARDKYNESCPVPCTQCRYCMPCPNGVDIPFNFANFNRGVQYKHLALARTRYGNWDVDRLAGACVRCRECEDKCPQSIPISEWMPYIHQVLGEGKEFDVQECRAFGGGR